MVPFKWIDLLSSPKWGNGHVLIWFLTQWWMCVMVKHELHEPVSCMVIKNSQYSFTGALQRPSNIICVLANIQPTCLLPCFCSNIQYIPTHCLEVKELYISMWRITIYISFYLCEIIQDGFLFVLYWFSDRFLFHIQLHIISCCDILEKKVTWRLKLISVVE